MAGWTSTEKQTVVMILVQRGTPDVIHLDRADSSDAMKELRETRVLWHRYEGRPRVRLQVVELIVRESLSSPTVHCDESRSTKLWTL